jgi:hypothetical protein
MTVQAALQPQQQQQQRQQQQRQQQQQRACWLLRFLPTCCILQSSEVIARTMKKWDMPLAAASCCVCKLPAFRANFRANCLSCKLFLQSSEALARAMKEWERRPGERTGFSDSPGDCLAFKYLRDVSHLYNSEACVQRIKSVLCSQH